MSGLDLNTYYGNVSKLGRVFNKLDSNQTAEAIEIAQINFNNNIKDISKVHLQDENLDFPIVNLKKEPIEYVIEEPLDDTLEW